jgi:outer membrane receptor for monomeric catechols
MVYHRLNSDTRTAFSDFDFLDKQEIINHSRVYVGKDDEYLIEWSFGGTAQLQANEWYPQKGENSRDFAQKQGEISNLA